MKSSEAFPGPGLAEIKEAERGNGASCFWVPFLSISSHPNSLKATDNQSTEIREINGTNVD